MSFTSDINDIIKQRVFFFVKIFHAPLFLLPPDNSDSIQTRTPKKKKKNSQTQSSELGTELLRLIFLVRSDVGVAGGDGSERAGAGEPEVGLRRRQGRRRQDHV